MMRKLISLFTIVSLSMSIYAQSLETVDWGSFKQMPEETSFQQAIGFDSDAFYYIRSDHKVGLNREKVWLESYSSLTNTFESSSEIILPSISESFGAVINEALLAGNYVLASNLAGGSSLINENINGNTFNPYEVNEMARLILDTISNPKIMY